jgi:hypothetical protein
VTEEAVTAQTVLDLMKMGLASAEQVNQYVEDLKAQAAKEEWSK